ncbi:MAG: GNAT family protein, partial [Deltaproteobacteria bacterium]
LSLRPMVPRDARELLDVVVASRRELGQFMSWPRDMASLEQARRFVSIGREGWMADRTARFGLFEREGGALVGSMELDGIDPRRSQAELGYWIRTDRARRGYATEAARAILLYAFQTLGLHKVRADVAVGNHPSARVLEKLGFTREGTLREDRPIGVEFFDHWRFGLLAREFNERYGLPASSSGVATRW